MTPQNVASDLSRESRVGVAPGIVFAEVDGDTVLLDGRSGVYYGLNQIGTRFWSLITSGVTLGGAQDALLAEYDVPADVLWRDLQHLVNDMVLNGLVVIDS